MQNSGDFGFRDFDNFGVFTSDRKNKLDGDSSYFAGYVNNAGSVVVKDFTMFVGSYSGVGTITIDESGFVALWGGTFEGDIVVREGGSFSIVEDGHYSGIATIYENGSMSNEGSVTGTIKNYGRLSNNTGNIDGSVKNYGYLWNAGTISNVVNNNETGNDGVIENITNNAEFRMYANGSIIKEPTNNGTWYTTVSFSPNGGTWWYWGTYNLELQEGDVFDKEFIQSLSNQLKYIGYVFRGWYLDDEPFNFDEKIGFNGISLTAKWDECVDHVKSDGYEIAPTCEAPGLKNSVICSICGLVLSEEEEEEVPALGHDWVLVSATDPTCAHDRSLYYSCLRCGSTKWEYEERLDHVFEVKEYVAPTCYSGGYTMFSCDGCGYSYYEYGNVLEHEWVLVSATEPECEVKGVKTFTCANCGDKYEEEIAALEHDYDDGVITIEPKCEVKGVKMFTCANCGDEFEKEIAALGHDFVITDDVLDPTDNDDGYEVYQCSRCVETKRVILPKLGGGEAPTLTGVATGEKNIGSIVESEKGTWTVTFTVTEKYADGSTQDVKYVEKIEKNSDGTIDLGDYILTYDIKGNGSNIKKFEVKLK